MSLFKTMILTCPHCGTENGADVVGSINADRRPDYRDAIMAGTFQDTTCSNCGESFRNEPDFTYLDMGRGQWVAALPARVMADYLEEEDRVNETFASAFGTGATPEAKAIGDTLTKRLTFGWPALREKLLVREHGLDDVTLECLKTDLIRRLESVPMAPGIELRLVAIEEGGRMILIWVNALTEDSLEQVALDRTLYDSIDANAEAWAPVRAALDEGPFVDMQRLYMGQGRAAAE